MQVRTKRGKESKLKGLDDIEGGWPVNCRKKRKNSNENGNKCKERETKIAHERALGRIADSEELPSPQPQWVPWLAYPGSVTVAGATQLFALPDQSRRIRPSCLPIPNVTILTQQDSIFCSFALRHSSPLLRGMGSPASDQDRARSLDRQDELRRFREQFIIPSQAQIHGRSLVIRDNAAAATVDAASRPCVYLCGNSLGLQPRRTAERIQQHLLTWAAQGVQGHFKPLPDSPLPTWLDADSKAAEMIAPIVGSKTSEVAVMQTLTANLHFVLSAFYRPQAGGRHKIILESKAFPSDHVNAPKMRAGAHTPPPRSTLLSGNRRNRDTNRRRCPGAVRG